MRKIPRNVAVLCLAILVGMLLLAGCGDTGSDSKAATSGYSISLPARIQPRTLPGDCADNITGSIQVDDQVPVSMVRQERAFTWTITLSSLSLGSHRFQLAFSCTSPAYGTITLAQAEQQVDLVEGDNNVSFPDSLFVFGDLDNDGVSNLDEIVNGTNPLPSSDIESNPDIAAVLPADGAIGISPVDALSVRFKTKLAADSVTEQSILVAARGEEVEGVVSYDASTNTLVFTPDQTLALLTEYTVTLSKSLSLEGDVPLTSEDLSWRFETRDGNWQLPKYVSGQPDSRYPAIAVNDKGDAIAIWKKGSNQIWARTFDGAKLSWGELRQVTDPDDLPTAITDDIIVKLSNSGTAVAAWSAFGGRSTIYRVCTSVSKSLASWVYAGCFDELGSSPDLGFLSSPELGFRSSGGAVIVWRQYPSDQPLTGVPFGDIAAGFLDPTWTFLGWREPGLIEGSVNTDADYPNLAFDGKGAAAAVWVDEDAGSTNVYANRFVNHQWGRTPVTLNTAPFDSDGYFNNDYSYYYTNQPQIAADTEGNLIAVWVQSNTEIWFNRFSMQSNSWGIASQIYKGSEGIRRLSLDSDLAGNAIVAWSSQYTIQTSRYSAFWRRWGETEKVVDNTGLEVGDLQIEVDVTGNALLVWSQYSDANKTTSDINASRFRAGEWSQPVTIDTQAKPALSPKIAMLPRGEAFVVWSSEGEIYAAQFK